MTSPGRRYVLAMVVLCLSTACARQSATAEKPKPAPTRLAHAFKGKIERVDATAKTVTVNGENVDGWMPAMTMVYSVDNAEVLSNVKVGDEIAATVYDGDFATLHRVEIKPVTAKTKRASRRPA